MDPIQSIVAACCALAVLTILVGIRMLSTRVGEEHHGASNKRKN